MITDVRIRPAEPADVPAIVAMVHELAEYERAPEQCHIRVEQLHAALFAPAPALYGHVATGRVGTTQGDRQTTRGLDTSAGRPRPADTEQVPLGFALWFLNFSTWEGVHGIYLEDLYVRPEARGTGLGRRLLATLAGICVERGYARLEWWVLHWNPAREFYDLIGATAMDEWVPYRLNGKPLKDLAGTNL